jgi:S-DNA-T family DNA segregation ATPase FtsK/SpoIIIE
MMRTTRSSHFGFENLSEHLKDFFGRRAAEMLGLALICVAAAGALALLTWSVQDPSLNHATSGTVRNFLGYPGAIISDLLMQLFGLGAGVMLAPIGLAGLRMMSSGRVIRPKMRFFLWVIGTLAATATASALPTTARWPLPSGLGGVAGDAILGHASALAGASPAGRLAVGLALALSAILCLSAAAGLGIDRAEAARERKKAAERRAVEDREDEDNDGEPGFGLVSFGALIHGILSVKHAIGRMGRRRDPVMPEVPARPMHRVEPGFGDTAGVLTRRSAEKDNRDRTRASATPFDGDDASAPSTKQPQRPRKPAPAAALSASSSDGYAHPALTLLSEARRATGPVMSADALEQNARLLEGVLDDFGVRGEIVKVHPGPVVTLYELEPAPGIKSSRVIGLADDIARSMSAVSARVAVVPGRNAIGIELPNAKRETVYLRELLDSPAFHGTSMKLALCLGKTIGGDPVIAELARMPHLLVAGTTGSGKSVAINTMILSLLYRLRPDECRLIMVDPKMLELSVYDGIPHLLTPVVTDPKKAVLALKWAVREMEERYKKMSKVGVRNIDGFNARVAEARAKGEIITRTVQTGFDRETGQAVYETEEMDLDQIPYIVVIVDEMADLMMVAGKEIEGTIQRLAQMARAAGIHVILATQRPSVDVITGTIKANFPTRISFQVTSKIDSRTILGEQGAEQLLGQGDMLYMAGGGRIGRVHGPFVSDSEVERVVAHLKSQGRPSYLEAVTREDDGEAEENDTAVFDQGSFGSPGSDPYDQAVAIVLRDRKASTSYIQRRLQIGYNKAASIMERMENEGIVGAANHAGKREILIEAENTGTNDGF